MDCWRVGRAGRRDESRLYVFFANQPCFTLLLDALQRRLFTNSDDGETDTNRRGNRCPFHACAVVRFTRAPLSVSRVRRFRFTRAPLPFHACAAVRFTRAPLPVDVCRPDIAFSTRSFFLAERACVPAVFWCGFPEKHCTGFCSSRMSDYLCCILRIAQIQSYSDGGLTLMQI